ncbi:ATP-binding cassette subfamily B protein [Stackebrandtia albiflava]|uniref:ATP-binding cassette subfamily B protein n=1 Tax=Stackebrandtia albiflava TaxID=406432 RepID=A0A562V2Y5_9ACTN|nr:ABC transporter ATP-binding protein [Stackebrandtia albiflava]TWJ12218.1 ATP-binding cassette subfamily B protein [Stackebrandtia albiflava]
MVALVLIAVATSVVQLTGPGIQGRFVDTVLASGTPAVLAALGAGYIGVAALSALGRIAVQWVGGRLAWRAGNALRQDLLAHCLDQDLSFYDTHSPGELIERIDSDVERLSRFLSELLVMLLLNSLLVIGIGVMLTTVDWRIGAGFALLLVVALFLVRRLVGVAVTALAEVSARSAEVSGFVEERLRALEDLVPNGGVPGVMTGLNDRSDALTRAASRAARHQIKWPALIQHVNTVALVGGLAAAVWLYSRGAIGVGDAYAVMAYLMLMRVPLMVIAGQLNEFDAAMAATRRSRELLAIRPRMSYGTTTLPAGALTVDLEDVHFGYTGRPVLRDVSLAVPAGHRLALVGSTGGGKTTLARLVARVLDPDAGTVRIGGVDARSVDRESLRRAVGYVTQDVRVLAASVRDNVTLYAAAPDQAVLTALEAVGLTGWLDSLPHGLDTRLGVDAGLSAGQEQLLSIARLLLRDPGLVILDEATARLGPEDRAAVASAVETLSRGRTVVVIAHRLDTVADCDSVAVVESGRITERGEYRRLADGDSRLAALIAAGEAL